MKALTLLLNLVMYKILEMINLFCLSFGIKKMGRRLNSSNLWIPPYKDLMSWTWSKKAQGKAATRPMHMFQELSGKASMEKKRFLSGIARKRGGGSTHAQIF